MTSGLVTGVPVLSGVTSGQLVWFYIACVSVVVWDWRARRVPNLLLLLLALVQLGLMISGYAFVTWMQAAIGLTLGFIGLLPFYVMRLMGAGDVKFASVLGGISGPHVLFLAWILAGLFACLHGLVSYAGARWAFASSVSTRRGIPYAAYLAVGACVVILSQPVTR